MSQALIKSLYTTENAKEHLTALLGLMKIDKVFFVDDSLLSDEPEVTAFIGEVRAIKDINVLKDELTFIEFNEDLEFLIDNINETWEKLSSAQKIKCFEVVYKALKKDYTGLNVASSLKPYFNDGSLILCTPVEWEENHFRNHHVKSDNILVLFDQDLSKSEGAFTIKKGENLILDIKRKGFLSNIFPALFTFTITHIEQEIAERERIIKQYNQSDEKLSSEDFFVFTKDRLNKPDLFADAIKKLFLNQYCEQVKNKTLNIASKAFTNTIQELNLLDTYSFDFAILKSSLNEGVWEAETLLRIINIYLDDFIKKEMIKSNYLLQTNEAFEKAHSISNSFNISIEGINKNPYQKPIELRTKEIFEAGEIINKLYKPLENGDIFEIIDSNNRKSTYVLVAQECDLMLRSTGKRKLQTGVLIYLSSKTFTALNKDEKLAFCDAETQSRSFSFWDTRYRLDHFENDKVGIVNFTNSSPLTVDLNFLDLVSLNNSGEAEINLKSKNRLNLQMSLKKRETIILSHLIDEKTKLDKLLKGLPKNKDRYKDLFAKLCPDLVLIGDRKVNISIDKNKISLRIKRLKRLRQPYARLLLEKYVNYLTRNAEQYDFAKKN